MLCFEFYMKSLPVNNEIKFSIYPIHRACVIVILRLVILRVFSCVFTCDPLFLANFPCVINVSETIHFILYSLVIVMLLSSYVMSFASDIKIEYIFYIPLLINKDKDLANTANLLYLILAYFMVFFIVSHIFGALKHIFIGKQNILKRII
nr:cytochrome b/b6 domain-containing protein [Wolbachia endosymbiont of Litomosoides sigmodontis]